MQLFRKHERFKVQEIRFKIKRTRFKDKVKSVKVLSDLEADPLPVLHPKLDGHGCLDQLLLLTSSAEASSPTVANVNKWWPFKIH